jgi:hypothetical protein
MLIMMAVGYDFLGERGHYFLLLPPQSKITFFGECGAIKIQRIETMIILIFANSSTLLVSTQKPQCTDFLMEIIKRFTLYCF